MASRSYIAEIWNEFSNKLGLANVSEVQRIETRRAFYAGAIGLWSVIFKNVSDGDEVMPEDLEKMAALEAEFQHYLEQLKKGAA